MKIEYETLSPDNEGEVYDSVISAVDDTYNLENKLVFGYRVKKTEGLTKRELKSSVKSKLTSLLNPDDLKIKVLTSGYDKILDKNYYYIGVQLTTYEVPLEK